MSRTLEAVIRNGPQSLYVHRLPFALAGMGRRVVVRMGEDIDSQMMMLTPSEARRLAIVLLEAAEEGESGSSAAR